MLPKSNEVGLIDGIFPVQTLLFSAFWNLSSTRRAQLQIPSRCDLQHRGRDSVSQPARWGQTFAMPMPNIPNYLLYFRDDMRLSTLILWGAVIQSMLVIALPPYVALLPAALMLGSRIMLSALTIKGILPYNGTKTVVPGRSTAQVPTQTGHSRRQQAQEMYVSSSSLHAPTNRKAASHPALMRSPTTSVICGRTCPVTGRNGVVSIHPHNF